MRQYVAPKAELIVFENEMIITNSPNCTCQDVTANDVFGKCTSGSLDNSYDTSEED